MFYFAKIKASCIVIVPIIMAKMNKYIEYITALGAHDILGAKQKKLVKILEETAVSSRL